MTRVASFVSILLLAATALAQSQSQVTTGNAGQAKRTVRHPRNGPKLPSAKQLDEMKKLTDSFAGLWKTTITIEPGPSMPAGGTTHGRSTISSGPAGNSMRESFHSYGGLGTVAGLGLTWWDTKAGAYRNIWCDNMSASGCDLTGTGQWEGNNLVFNGTSEMNGKPMKTRETYSDITANSFVFTMEVAAADAPLAKVMTIKYERSVPRTENAPAAPAGDPPSFPAPPQS